MIMIIIISEIIFIISKLVIIDIAIISGLRYLSDLNELTSIGLNVTLSKLLLKSLSVQFPIHYTLNPDQ